MGACIACGQPTMRVVTAPGVVGVAAYNWACPTHACMSWAAACRTNDSLAEQSYRAPEAQAREVQ